jgi:hypothetical protein
MDGGHIVVGIEGILVILFLLFAFYLIVSFAVSHELKSSGLKTEIKSLKNEILELRESINKKNE